MSGKTMKDNPIISVLIPIYNVEVYLEECLRSLQDQTFRDFEAICLNDGSTDGSKAIIEAFAAMDDRFILVDKPNSGYGASMNKGLSLARGEYISILESDDTMFPDALETLYSLQQKFNADVVKGDYCLHWSDPAKKDQKRNMFPGDMTDKLYDARTLEYIYLQEASIWSALYRKDFLDKHEIDFLETPGASY
ncbi:MAG: glycosyltransferase, partial [Streptococcus salivarius]|nr:glycosyltransferase [Streptococcus salivarius]